MVRFLARDLRRHSKRKEVQLCCPVDATDTGAVQDAVSTSLSWLRSSWLRSNDDYDPEWAETNRLDKERQRLWKKGVKACPVASKLKQAPSLPESATVPASSSGSGQAASASLEVKAAPPARGEGKQSKEQKQQPKMCPMRGVYESELGGNLPSVLPVRNVPVTTPDMVKRDREDFASAELADRIFFYPPLYEWSPETHRHFPLPFRRAVRCVLLIRTLRPAGAVVASKVAGKADAKTQLQTKLDAARQPFFPECLLWKVPWPLMLRIIHMASDWLAID
jgi:hypothetical protein